MPSSLRPNGYNTSEAPANNTEVTAKKKKDKPTEASTKITEPPPESEMLKYIKYLASQKNVVVRHEDFPENTPMTKEEYDLFKKTLY